MLASLGRKIGRSLKERGLIHTAGWLAAVMRHYGRRLPLLAEKWIMDRAFDLWFGVEMRGTIDLEHLKIDSENVDQGNRYEPIVPWMLHRMIGALPIDYGQFTFLDLGSGKGRALLLAAQWPFRRILGVEFSEELHLVAQLNIAACKRRRLQCRNVRSLWCDAVHFPIPSTKLVLYV